MLDENRKKLKIEKKLARNLDFVHGSTWSKIGILISLLTAGLIVTNYLIPAALTYLAAGFCDLVDGMVSRRHKISVRRDAFIDTISDRYVDFIILLSIFTLNLLVPFPAVLVPLELWLFIYLFGSMVAAYVKSAAKEKNFSSKQLRFGFIQRAERIYIICIALVVATLNPFYFSAIIAFLAAEINIEALYRYRKILRKEFN